MGQCNTRHHDIFEWDHAPSTVSLSKAKALSSNAAITAARFHCTLDGGRRLEDDYEVKQDAVLGEGLCGKVVLAHHRADKQRYAMKTISKQRVSPAALKQLSSEVEIYLTLDHPGIARLHDVYETQSAMILLTEYCEGGELYSRLHQCGVYKDADAAEAARQMLRAVGYLHSRHVVHRDLKLENFLYESQDSSALLKLIDFGFAKIWDPSTLMTASCGSVAYVSPDVLSGQGYTDKCDLWSIGVIVWMLLAGYPPFHGGEKEMLDHIKLGCADWSHVGRWMTVSADAQEFVKLLLTIDPAKRPDARQALQHRWLARSAGTCRPGVLSRDLLRSLQKYAEASKARRAVLQLLAQELTLEETRELRDTFLSLDRSYEGTINLSDLKEAIRGGSNKSPKRRKTRVNSVESLPMEGESAGGPGSPTTPARRLRRADSHRLGELFEMLDANGNERIFYSDFLAATMETRLLRKREEAFQAAFRRLDADSSGKISARDLHDVFGKTFEGTSVEELIAEVASPRAGGELTFEAFARVVGELDPLSPAYGGAHTPNPSSPGPLSPPSSRGGLSQRHTFARRGSRSVSFSTEASVFFP